MIDTLDQDGVVALEAEHEQIWGRCAGVYVRCVEGLTGAATEELLDAAEVGDGTQLLDVGAGPGTVIGPALARGASVCAVDLTPQMIDELRTRHPGVDARVANATSLPFADESFDAVTMSFCVHHMAEPAAALTETWRVLRTGGRVAMTVWAPTDRLVAFGLGYGGLSALSVELQQLHGAPLDNAEPGDYPVLLTDAGFVDVTVREVAVGWDVSDPTTVSDLFDRLLNLGSYGSDVQRTYAAAVASAAQAWSTEAGTTLAPNPAILITGRRPAAP
jgi:SAM-dependent methyltransferase